MRGIGIGAVFRCDRVGRVVEIIADGLGIPSADILGHPVESLVTEPHRASTRAFVTAAVNDGAAFACRIEAEVGGRLVRLNFDGTTIDGEVLIIAKPDQPAAVGQAEIDAFSALNNQLVNRQRELVRNLMSASFPAAAGEDHPPPAGTRFSLAESAVIPLLLNGLTNRLIATLLGIQESAVKARLRSLYHKLGVANRAQAVKQLLETERF